MSNIFLDERVLWWSENMVNSIKIGPVEGILKEPLQYSVEANWENIFNIGLGGAQRALSLVNVGLLNTGVWSRKFYKGGSYLRITPKMRVVNWDGGNDVINQARQLTDLCLPAYKGKSLEQVFENFDPAELAKEAAGGIIEAFSSKEKLVGGLKKIIDEASSNSPKPVTVSVSNFFTNSFIVESVQVEFSKEMTPQGPLYADFEIVLSTPEVTIRGGTGLRNVPQRYKSR